jgi:hypothetical protein
VIGGDSPLQLRRSAWRRKRRAEFLAIVESAEGLEVRLAATQRVEAELERHVAGDDREPAREVRRLAMLAKPFAASLAAPRIGSSRPARARRRVSSSEAKVASSAAAVFRPTPGTPGCCPLNRP